MGRGNRLTGAARLLVLWFCLTTAGGWVTQAEAYTSEQAIAGQRIFSQHCLECHGLGGVGGEGPVLRGEKFTDRWQTVEDTANFIRFRMPAESPGVLDNQEVYRVLSYLLSLRGLPADGNLLTPISAGEERWPLDSDFAGPEVTVIGPVDPSDTVTLHGEATPRWRLPDNVQDLLDWSKDTHILVLLLWGVGLALFTGLAWRLFAPHERV